MLINIIAILIAALTGIMMDATGATILINGVPVDKLYVDKEGRLYLKPGKGRIPVSIEIPSQTSTNIPSRKTGLKIGGTAYIHYDIDTMEKNHSSSFKLTRSYFNVRKPFNDNDYFRITFDVKQEENSGGNMDGSYTVRLKYAYAYIRNTRLPYTGIELGISHRPWIDWEEHHGWLHRDLEETFIENHKSAGLVNSSDLGINLKGRKNHISWSLGMFNGEGYHGTENSKHFGKSIEARLSAKLTDTLTISGHTVHSFDHQGKDMDRHIYHIHGIYNKHFFLLSLQYVWSKDNYQSSSDIDRKGYSINSDIMLKPFIGYPVGILTRYDHWDDNNNLPQHTREHYVYGLFYRLNNFLKLTIAHDRVISQDNAGNDSSSLMGVARIKW